MLEHVCVCVCVCVGGGGVKFNAWVWVWYVFPCGLSAVTAQGGSVTAHAVR